MEKIILKIGGMSCTHCVLAVENELKDAGYQDAEVEVGSVTIEYNGKEESKSEIIELIKSAGYGVMSED